MVWKGNETNVWIIVLSIKGCYQSLCTFTVQEIHITGKTNFSLLLFVSIFHCIQLKAYKKAYCLNWPDFYLMSNPALTLCSFDENTPDFACTKGLANCILYRFSRNTIYGCLATSRCITCSAYCPVWARSLISHQTAAPVWEQNCVNGPQVLAAVDLFWLYKIVYV